MSNPYEAPEVRAARPRPSPAPIAPARDQRTAIIKREQAAWLLKWILRVLAIITLYGSWLGAAMLLAGGPPTPWWDMGKLPTNAILWGFAIQAPITLAEFANRHRRSSWSYRIPLILDVGSTYLGFRPIIVPWLYVALHGSAPDPALGLGLGLYAVIANIIALFLAWVAARFPELTLVE